jgi:CubicO group peptidase (beta-lactamase class C family)
MQRMPAVFMLVAVLNLCDTSGPCRAQARNDARPPVEQRIRNTTSGLADFPPGPPSGDPKAATKATLAERMTALKVPGVSVAVIDEGRIEWARGFGVIRAGGPAPVTTETMFEAASTSKLITAAIALRLVEQGKLALDEDVSARLKSWRIPESDFTRTQKVTLRRLLTHQAGLSRPDGGFREEPGSAPTLLQVLEGGAPALNKPAVVEFEPGSKWSYSNFGFIVIQLLIEDALGKPFPQIARELVFQPLGMTSSTFVHPVSAALKTRTIVPHDEEGVAHDRPLHPRALGHGGLLTTPSDLARFTVELMSAHQGRSHRLLSRKMAQAMLGQEVALDPAQFAGLVSGQGLGAMLLGSGQRLVFFFAGANGPGATSLVVGCPASGQGAAIMTNAANGELLMIQLMLTIRKEYGWPLETVPGT